MSNIESNRQPPRRGWGAGKTCLCCCGVILLLIAIVAGIVALVVYALYSAGKTIKEEGIKIEGTDKDGRPISISFDPSKMFATTSTTTEAPITDLIAGRFEHDSFDNIRFSSSSRNDLSSLAYKIADSEDKFTIKRDDETSFTMTINPSFKYMQSFNSGKEISFTSGKVFQLARFVDSHNTVDVTIEVGESSWSEKHVGYQTVNIKREFSKEGMKATYSMDSVSCEKIFKRKRG